MPLVTVVIPTFGRPQLLKNAVDSVLAQTVTDLELIVVVDGDDPGTAAYLKSVNDPRLRSIFHDRQRGAGQTRDTGALAGLGEWVAFLDDDDVWLPEKLEKQLQSAPSEPAILMTLSWVQKNAGSFIKPDEPYDPSQPFDEWLFGQSSFFKGRGSFLQTSSLMMPRRLFEHLSFHDTRQHEEWELVLRAIKQRGYKLVTTREPLVIHYFDENRASLSKTYTWRRSLEWVNAMRGLITPRGYAAFCLTVAGRMAASAGDWSAFFPLLGAALRHGRPGARELFIFFMLWCMPPGFRHKLRATLQGERKPQAA
jgi:glycosyltransferase involved in cell wall biosynthesis